MASQSEEHQPHGVQTQQPGAGLSIAQARVLRSLSGGAMLTEQQIKAAASLTSWKTRQAVATLSRRDLIYTSAAHPGRWEITGSGRRTLAAHASAPAEQGA